MGQRAGPITAVMVTGIAVVWLSRRPAGFSGCGRERGRSVRHGSPSASRTAFCCPPSRLRKPRRDPGAGARPARSGAVLADVTQRGQAAEERLCSATARRGAQTAMSAIATTGTAGRRRCAFRRDRHAEADTERTKSIGRGDRNVPFREPLPHRTGHRPRQSDPAIDKALAVIFGASDLAADPLAPTEIDKAFAWLKAADRSARSTFWRARDTTIFQSSAVGGASAAPARHVVAFADDSAATGFPDGFACRRRQAQMRAAPPPAARPSDPGGTPTRSRDSSLGVQEQPDRVGL